MPFNWNLRQFGRYNPQPAVSNQFQPTGGNPGNFNAAGGPSYGPVPNGQAPNQFNTHSEFESKQTQRRRAMHHLAMPSLIAFCLFVTVIFLIVVEIGNTYNEVVLRDIWFLKLNFADISPAWNNTPGLGYGIAQYADLHDFYQIGLWNYCEGWNSTGISSCTTPEALYYWNPWEMFVSQLPADAQDTPVPEILQSSLSELKICSNWIFGLFMAGACLSFVLIPTVFLGLRMMWVSIGLAVITFLNALMVLAATIIATVLWVVIRRLFKDYEEIVNVVPHIGTTMFVVMWIATAFAIFAFILQVAESRFSVIAAKERRAQLKQKEYAMSTFE